jgi:peroxiredoxin
MAHPPQKNNHMIKILTLLLLTLTFNYKAYAAQKVGDKISDATLYGLNTPSTKLSKYHGKPLIINFWASWCSPCVSEMQSLNNIANHPHYTIIGISTDDDASAAMQLIKQQQLSFNNYIDDNMHLEKAFGASTIPLTVLIDKQGTIIRVIQGSQQWDSQTNRARIRKLFNVPD